LFTFKELTLAINYISEWRSTQQPWWLRVYSGSWRPVGLITGSVDVVKFCELNCIRAHERESSLDCSCCCCCCCCCRCGVLSSSHRVMSSLSTADITRAIQQARAPH